MKRIVLLILLITSLGFSQRRAMLQKITAAPPPSGFLLDNYPTLSAYSLRRLSSSTTNVIRVQRSNNDELDFTPEEIEDGTLLSWITATGTIGYVVTIYKQGAGAANNTTGTAGTNRNLIYDSGFVVDNGKKAIGAIGGGSIDLTLASSETAQTVFVVTRDTNPNNLAVCYVIGSNTDVDGVRTSGTVITGIGAYTQSNNSVNSTVEDAFQHLITINTNQGNVRVDGVQEANGTMGSIIWNIIGRRNFNGPFGITGYFQEVIWSNDNQTANISAIEADINAYYGIY